MNYANDTTLVGSIVRNGFGTDLKSLKKWTTVNICFWNPVDDREDTTQFDVENLSKLEGQMELVSLFENFCKENKIDISEATVFDTFYVRSANTYEQLLELEAEEEGYSFRES